MMVDRDVGEEVRLDESSTKAKLSLSVFKYGTAIDMLLVTISILFNLASGVVMPVFMSLFGDMMDSIGSSDVSKVKRPLTYYVKAQLICGTICFVLSSVGAATMELASVRQTRALKLIFLETIMRQEIGWFDQSDPGKLATTLQQNCVTLSDAIGLKFAQIFMFLGMFVGGYAVAFYRDWKLTLVVSSSLPVIALTAGFMFLTIAKADEKARRAYAGAGSVVEESMIAIRPIVAFGLEQKMINLFNVRLAASFKSGLRTALAAGSGLGLTMGVLFLTYALGFWYGGKLISEDLSKHGLDCFLSSSVECYTGGKVMSVFFCVLIAAFALGQAGPNIAALGKAGAAVDSLDRVITRQSLIDPYSEEGFKVAKGDIKGDIRFDRVRFAYPTRRDQIVYKHLSFIVPAGQTVALVGASGCGKSTAVSLIERFYDVDYGCVLIDNRDVREYNLRCLRQRIGLVSQEPRLFAATIADNIRCGRWDATESEIESAARQANAHSFISEFPLKYETFVGEGGGQLSGGQKQRIAIARAILRDPEILILDEATSALDNESERIVQETLDKIVQAKRRTTIVIAHRLSTIRKADKIIVLDNDGQGSLLAEQGSHQQLIDKGGLYAALVEAQRLDADGSEGLNEQLVLVHSFQDQVPKSTASLIRLRSEFSKVYNEGDLISKDEFMGDDFEKRGGIKRVLRNFRPYSFQVAMGIIGAILNGMVFPCFAICFGGVVNALYLTTAEQVKHDVNQWCLIFVGFAIGVALANILQHTFFGWAGYKALEILRRELFESIIHQDLAFFDEPGHTSGAISELLSADVVLLKGWVGDNLGIYLQNIVSLIAALVVAFTASAKLAGVAIGAFLIIIPAVMLQAQFMQSGADSVTTKKKKTETDAETTGLVMQETIVNIRTVAAYTLEKQMADRYARIVIRDYNKGVYQSYFGGIAWGFSQFVQFAVQALCLWYGGKLVAAGEIQTNKMMRTIFALIMAAMGMGQTMIFTTNNSEAATASHRVYGIIDRRPLVDARSLEGKPFESIQDDIKFEHVNFRYPQRRAVPIYSNINFNIKRGEVVALVGPSGCGKSTAVQLLERFYDIGNESGIEIDGKGTVIENGRISLDGNDIRDLNVKSLRSKIGLVSQEPILFADTIYENIACGSISDQVDLTQVEDAARKANAYNFISSFPNQFETDVGKLGNQLSGGQKQRIAIARALIRDPEILILDEATSALDAESEKVVQAALDSLLAEKTRTTIVIAHRLSTIRNSDKIVVMLNKGRGSYVAEVGKHEELLNIPNGIYRHLVHIAQGK